MEGLFELEGTFKTLPTCLVDIHHVFEKTHYSPAPLFILDLISGHVERHTTIVVFEPRVTFAHNN